MSKRLSRALLVALALVLAAGLAAADRQTVVVEALSDPMTVDEIIRPMFGPESFNRFRLEPDRPDEVIWVTAARAEIVEAESGADASPEYLCHGNLAFNRRHFNPRVGDERFGGTANLGLRLFTLVPGQEEIRLPPNTGIPMVNHEAIRFESMVASNNEPPEPKRLKVRSHFEYVRDSELEEPLKPLFQVGLSLRVSTAEPHHRNELASALPAAVPHPEGAGEGCALPDETPMPELEAAAGGEVADVAETVDERRIVDTERGPESYHWYVPPGRHEYRYRLIDGVKSPFDTTLHYAAGHLHPYGESIELWDVTEGRRLLRFEATSYEDRVGIRDITHFESREGMPLASDHEYEMVAVYDNPTDEPVDAMGMLFLYLHDKSFDIERAAQTPTPYSRGDADGR